MKLYNYTVKFKPNNFPGKSFMEGNLEGVVEGLDENDAKRKIKAEVSEALGITLTAMDVSDGFASAILGAASHSASATVTAVSASSGPGSSVASSSKP
ncbi:hypothetical protein PSEMO_03580 [Pseudomonas putida]|uniref:Uncharacterized protein n=2 Tax=Pseudomonas putida TaxID=303 RepID=A0A1Q9RB12_PSEPU|nr:hypothetical protein PSEMO_03580 [Pseudomonas putida]